MARPHVPHLDAIFFDCDGVLLDSVHVKEREFRRLMESRIPAFADAAMEYYWANGGTSRLNKFRWIWANLVRNPLSDSEVAELGTEFADRVFQGVVNCPMVAGAAKFLKARCPDLPAFVISGTPDEELKRVIHARNLTHFFRGVFGSPRNKTQIGRDILATHGYHPRNVVFVGDATTDQEAARELGVFFVGLSGPHLTPYLKPGEITIPDLAQLESTLKHLPLGSSS